MGEEPLNFETMPSYEAFFLNADAVMPSAPKPTVLPTLEEPTVGEEPLNFETMPSYEAFLNANTNANINIFATSANTKALPPSQPFQSTQSSKVSTSAFQNVKRRKLSPNPISSTATTTNTTASHSQSSETVQTDSISDEFADAIANADRDAAPLPISAVSMSHPHIPALPSPAPTVEAAVANREPSERGKLALLMHQQWLDRLRQGDSIEEEEPTITTTQNGIDAEAVSTQIGAGVLGSTSSSVSVKVTRDVDVLQKVEEAEWGALVPSSRYQCCDKKVGGCAVYCDTCEEPWHIYCLRHKYHVNDKELDRVQREGEPFECYDCVREKMGRLRRRSSMVPKATIDATNAPLAPKREENRSEQIQTSPKPRPRPRQPRSFYSPKKHASTGTASLSPTPLPKPASPPQNNRPHQPRSLCVPKATIDTTTAPLAPMEVQKARGKPKMAKVSAGKVVKMARRKKVAKPKPDKARREKVVNTSRLKESMVICEDEKELKEVHHKDSLQHAQSAQDWLAIDHKCFWVLPAQYGHPRKSWYGITNRDFETLHRDGDARGYLNDTIIDMMGHYVWAGWPAHFKERTVILSSLFFTKLKEHLGVLNNKSSNEAEKAYAVQRVLRWTNNQVRRNLRRVLDLERSKPWSWEPISMAGCACKAHLMKCSSKRVPVGNHSSSDT